MSTNFVDSLLSKIDDESLCDQLTNEFNKLRDNKEFGLVFERHIPEYVRLYKREITEGAHVQLRSSKSDDIFTVREISGKKAKIADKDGKICVEKLDELVVVIRHGESIYPGLVEVGRVERGGDKPFHTVINAENYHALQLLLYTHEGKIDCIYIDPPYNTGAKDWKYNNDYVDSEDRYRHSKWLSFMEKRLKLAKRLLNPEDSVLIVTIDEKEYLRLGLLLGQIFPNSVIQMISSVINPKGATRANSFGRTDEYIFSVMLGESSPSPIQLGNEWKVVQDKRASTLRWAELLRSGSNTQREDSPNQFYPVHVQLTESGPTFHSVGEAYFGSDWKNVTSPSDCYSVWPIRSDGSEGNWQISKKNLEEAIKSGYAKLGKWRKEKTSITYLKRGEKKKVEDGVFPITGRRSDNSIIIDDSEYLPTFIPGTQWRISSHNAEQGGTNLLKNLIPGIKFPFPKSLYAVEDTIRFFTADKPDAVVVDFFAGSGTTTHAVMRLNKQDSGKRISISVTNNAVSNQEENSLKDRGYGPNDAEWEALGIYEYITMPRITSAVTGKNSDGGEIQGEYKFTDIFPISDGFEENVRFLKLEHNDSDSISRNESLSSISHVLWLISGCIGRVIDEVTDSFTIQHEGHYGILFNTDFWQEFVDDVKQRDTITHVFIITDSKVQYQQVVKHLPTNIKTTMLYEDYLRNFQIGV